MTTQSYNPFRRIFRKEPSQPAVHGDSSSSSYVDVTASALMAPAHSTGQSEESIHLNARTGRRRLYNPNFALYLPLVGIGYLIHMRYRYYKPRRLPPLTPMRITEIYALAAVSVSIGTEAILHWELAHRDRDLCTIQTLAMCFRTNGGPFLEKSREKSTVESTRTWDELRAEFTNYPKDGSLAQKFVWWYNHAWSDPLVWGLLYEDQYLPVQKHKLEPTLSKGDWDILITHLANAMQGSDGKLSALAPWRFFRAFLLITPFALGARLLFLPRIVLPLSIAQRVLIYCSLTLYLNRTYQHCHYPLRLQDRHSVALVLNQLAPDLPEIVNTIMSGGRHFPL